MDNYKLIFKKLKKEINMTFLTVQKHFQKLSLLDVKTYQKQLNLALIG